MTLQTNTNRDSRQVFSWLSLGGILLARLLINAQFRIIYPFLPAISRGLGVPLETGSLLVTLRALTGCVASPLLGGLSDRLGRRALMMSGLVALAAGAALVAGARGMALALLGFALFGIARAGYDPAMQAYLGDSVSYDRRGRIMGLVELSWAGSWLIGVPVAGLMIERLGWRSPFVVIAVLGVISLVVTHRLIRDPRAGRPAPSASGKAGGTRAWVTWPVVIGLVVSSLIVIANENLYMVYGAWLESQYGLSVSSLGLASIVISVAELIAAGTSAAIVDRMGKRRSLLAGLILNAAAYLFLPRTAGTLVTALGGMVLLALTAEFCIVTVLPLVSELAPQARGTVMAVNAALVSAGVMGVSLVSPRLWSSGGLSLVTLVSAVAAGLAALCLWRGLSEITDTSEAAESGRVAEA